MGAAIVVGIFGALVWVFVSGAGRLTPAEKYDLMLDAMPYSADRNGLVIASRTADSPTDFERKGSGTATYVIDGDDPYQELGFTIFKTRAAAAIRYRVWREHNQGRDDVQSINTYPPEYCVKQPEFRFACSSHFENVFVRSEIVASKSDWRFLPNDADLTALLFLRVLRKMFYGLVLDGRTGPR